MEPTKLDRDLVRRVKLFALDYNPGDPEQVSRIVEKAIEIAPSQPVPSWRRSKKGTTWTWHVYPHFTMKIWKTRGTQWAVHAQPLQNTKGHMSLRKTSGGGKAQLEAFLLYEMAIKELAAG